MIAGKRGWDRRLRFGGQSLGHAMGEAFISDKRITTVLEAHPEYLAKIDGKYAGCPDRAPSL